MLPWDLTNEKTAQGIAVLYKDVMEVSEEVNQFFKNRLTEIFPRALRLSGQEDYPLSGYLGFSYVKYRISLQFRNRSAPRNLIDRVKTLVSEAEVDDFEKLLDIPLEVCSLLKQLKRKETLSAGSNHSEAVDLEKELVRNLLGKCMTSKIDEVSFLGRIQAAEGRLITMSEVQRRISNIYAEHQARRQYEVLPTLRHKTVNHAQAGQVSNHSDHPSPESGSSGARHGRHNDVGRGSQHGGHRGSEPRGGGWRDSQFPAHQQQPEAPENPWQAHSHDRGQWRHSTRGRSQDSQPWQPRGGNNNPRGQGANRGGRGKMQTGRRGRREQWAGPLLPHKQLGQPRVQFDEEQEDPTVGRAGAGGGSGDSWQRRKQRGHGSGPHTTRGGSEQSASLRHVTPQASGNVDSDTASLRIDLLEEKLDILADRLMKKLAPDHPSRTATPRRPAVPHANEGRVLYLTDGRSPVDDGALIGQAPATSDRRTRNVSQRLGEREELESGQEASDTDNPFQSGDIHVRRVMRRVHVCLDIEKLLRAKAFLNVQLPGCYHTLLDTGANISLCGDRSLLTNVRKSPQPTIVSTASGEKFVCDEQGDLTVHCTITNEGNVTIAHTILITAMVCAETPLTIFSMSQFLGEEKTVELSGKSTGSWVCLPGSLQLRLPVHLWEGVYVLKAEIDQSTHSLVIAAQSNGRLGSVEAAALLTRCAAEQTVTDEGDEVSLKSMGSEDIPALPSNPIPTILWHWRLGHTSDRVQRMLAKGDNRVTYSSTHRTVSPCHVCRTSKFSKLPLRTQGGYRQDRADRINSQWNVDLKDMGTVSEPGRFRYLLVIVDAFSGYIVSLPLTNKGETKEVMESFILQEERSGRPAVVTIVSDNGSEFANLQLQSFVKMRGIIWNFTPDYTSAANGRAERAIRTITTIHRAISYQAQVPQRFWHFSVQQATLIFNSLPNLTNRDGLSPWQLYQGREFDYDKLKVFGCIVFVANEEKLKNEMPAITAVNLGNSEAHMGYQPGYLVYNPVTNKVIHTRHARFDETFFHFRRTSRLHLPPGQEYVGLREEDECSAQPNTDPGSSGSEDASMTEPEDDAQDADWEPGQPAEGKLLSPSDESLTGNNEVGRKRTRSDFRADRTVMERQYVNRKATYGGRAATITQVVFRNGAFSLKLKYDQTENDWIIVQTSDPKLRLTSEREPGHNDSL